MRAVKAGHYIHDVLANYFQTRRTGYAEVEKIKAYREAGSLEPEHCVAPPRGGFQHTKRKGNVNRPYHICENGVDVYQRLLQVRCVMRNGQPDNAFNELLYPKQERDRREW